MYRQVNATYREPFDHFHRSGLYDDLAADDLIVAHEEVPLRPAWAPAAAAVIRPAQIPFISYPYEWCFGQLKAAALLTLEIQRRALGRSMILRDASAYNVQFVGSRPIFIDSLSFGIHTEGEPWRAYRQFCQHFLAPLALMSLSHDSLGNLSRVYLDGVPLDVATSLLPLTYRFRPGLLLHLHLHGNAARRATDAGTRARKDGRRVGRTAMLGLIDSLERAVAHLSWTPPATVWSTYDRHHTYSPAAVDAKRRTVAEMIRAAAATSELRTIWDLGANTGSYSRIAADVTSARVVSFDGDHAAVEEHYDRLREVDEQRVLPLVQDLANPSPSIGWNGEERRSLASRGPADLALALALVHHLAIGCQVPLDRLATFFAGICRRLVIEFVPEDDSQVLRMLAHREASLADYSVSAFERAFAAHFDICRSTAVLDTGRTLYLMERR